MIRLLIHAPSWIGTTRINNHARPPKAQNTLQPASGAPPPVTRPMVSSSSMQLHPHDPASDQVAPASRLRARMPVSAAHNLPLVQCSRAAGPECSDTAAVRGRNSSGPLSRRGRRHPRMHAGGPRRHPQKRLMHAAPPAAIARSLPPGGTFAAWKDGSSPCACGWPEAVPAAPSPAPARPPASRLARRADMISASWALATNSARTHGRSVPPPGQQRVRSAGAYAPSYGAASPRLATCIPPSPVPRPLW